MTTQDRAVNADGPDISIRSPDGVERIIGAALLTFPVGAVPSRDVTVEVDGPRLTAAGDMNAVHRIRRFASGRFPTDAVVVPHGAACGDPDVVRCASVDGFETWGHAERWKHLCLP